MLHKPTLKKQQKFLMLQSHKHETRALAYPFKSGSWQMSMC